jgi:Domain of unknown function (DUF1707)
MDTPTGDIKRGAIRVSDAERDQAVAELGEHYQAGRLTLEEFDDRSSQALRAKTGSDLGALFTDLPKGAAPSVLAPASTVADISADPVERRSGRPFTARTIIACVIAVIVVGNVAGGLGAHHLGAHHLGFGWLVPVVILSLVFLRLGRRR